MQEIKKRVSAYEQKQKSKLVVLGQGNKPYNEILQYVVNEHQSSLQIHNFRYALPCFRSDGAYQLNKAIESIYGVAQSEADKGPSKDGAIETLDIKLADGSRIKVPYGKIALPDLGEDASIDIGYDTAKNELVIKGSCEKRFSSMIDEIVDETKELLNKDSIYKDQAFELDSNMDPKILDLSNLDKEFLILSKKTERRLRPLMIRVRQPEKCLERGIPLKTGVMLSGSYGTGKTLLAFKVAKEATDNGWSFIYLKDPQLLARVLRLSKTLDNNGHGIIVFVEDIDQVVSGDRDSAMQDILNTLDGGDTKQMNVIALFTTNHIEKINPTFLRGKRIGSIVPMESLDAATAKEFIYHTFQGMEIDPEGLEEVCLRIEKEQIVPAFMAEITETVKSNLIYEDSEVIKATHIEDSLDSYLEQVALSRTETKKDDAATKFREGIEAVFYPNKTQDSLKEITQAVL